MKKIMLSVGVALGGLVAFKKTANSNAAAQKTVNLNTTATATAATTTTTNIDTKAKTDSARAIATDEGFYRGVLKGLAVNATPEKIKFLKAWRQGEGGAARNNPFNTTKDIPGTADTKYNSVGVRNYPDRLTGLAATVATLKLSYYKHLVDLLKKDYVTARELARSSALKIWGTGSRVKTVLATGKVNPPAIAG